MPAADFRYDFYHKLVFMAIYISAGRGILNMSHERKRDTLNVLRNNLGENSGDMGIKKKSAKAVVCAVNLNLSDAIFNILVNYLDKKNIVMYTSDADAAQTAATMKPDFLIITGNPLHYLNNELFDYRALADSGIQSIIIHDSDIDLYRDELNVILTNTTGYENLRIVKFNMFHDMIHALLAG